MTTTSSTRAAPGGVFRLPASVSALRRLRPRVLSAFASSERPHRISGQASTQRIHWLLAVVALLAIAFEPPMAQSRSFFPDRDMMTVGVYYYPEAWPRGQWARDFANIRKHGFEFVHMGEFAWAFMEPEDGRFDFAWLDEAVRLAAAQGLKVVLCTPTATPPAWLARAHPEILMVNERGRRMNHGSREHATWSSALYRKYVERIIDQLGKRYGRNRDVWGWQIDNELSHYGRRYSYAEPDQQKFRAWRACATGPSTR